LRVAGFRVILRRRLWHALVDVDCTSVQVNKLFAYSQLVEYYCILEEFNCDQQCGAWCCN
jgi:hypothetical protein